MTPTDLPPRLRQDMDALAARIAELENSVEQLRLFVDPGTASGMAQALFEIAAECGLSSFSSEAPGAFIRKKIAELQSQLAAVTKERDEAKAEAERLKDDPDADGTDFAHPAWWRAHDHTTAVFCREVNEILDSKELSGIANEPWESTRRRIAGLLSDLDSARRSQSEAESELETYKAYAGDEIVMSDFQTAGQMRKTLREAKELLRQCHGRYFSVCPEYRDSKLRKSVNDFLSRHKPAADAGEISDVLTVEGAANFCKVIADGTAVPKIEPKPLPHERPFPIDFVQEGSGDAG